MSRTAWIVIGLIVLNTMLVSLATRAVDIEVDAQASEMHTLDMRVDWLETNAEALRKRVRKVEQRLDTAVRMIPDYYDPGWYEEADPEWEADDITTATIDQEVIKEVVEEVAVVEVPEGEGEEEVWWVGFVIGAVCGVFGFVLGRATA